MMRLINLAAILVVLAASYALYVVKYEATDYSRQVSNLRSEIEAERDNINVLKAEWSFLTQPQRIQRLADRYLELDTLKAEQILTIEEFRNRFGAVADADREAVTGTISNSANSGAD